MPSRFGRIALIVSLGILCSVFVQTESSLLELHRKKQDNGLRERPSLRFSSGKLAARPNPTFNSTRFLACRERRSADSPTVRNVLIQMYQQLNGPKWNQYCQAGWLSNQSYCCWQGVTCDIQHNVTYLYSLGCGWEGVFPNLNEADFPFLNKLTLSYNPKLRFESNFTISPSVVNLDIERTDTRTLPLGIMKLTRLESLLLNMPTYGLTMPPAFSFSTLTSLTDLQLSNASLTALPTSLGDLTSLTTLSLSLNNISMLPDSYCQLTKLSSVDASSAGLKALPDCLASIPCVTEMDFSFNELTSLPSSLGGACERSYIKFDGNRLTSLPASLCDTLMQTETLSFVGNGLSTLPSCNMTGRQPIVLKAYFSDNQLTTIPATFLQTWANAYLCDLSNNLLPSIPASFHALQSVVLLALSRNRITSVAPEAANGFTQIESLDLSLNNLTTLPVISVHYEALQILNVAYNQLSDFANWFSGESRAPRLRELYMSHNLCTEIPWWATLRATVVLAENNRITTYPFQDLAGAPTLLAVSLRGNMINGNEDCRAIVRPEPPLTEIDISYNNLTSNNDDTFGIVQCLSNAARFPSLRALDLSHNALRGSAIYSFEARSVENPITNLTALTDFGTLMYFDVSYNQFEDFDLRRNGYDHALSNLKHYDVSHNKLSVHPRAATGLFNPVWSSPTLQLAGLSLEGNPDLILPEGKLPAGFVFDKTQLQWFANPPLVCYSIQGSVDSFMRVSADASLANYTNCRCEGPYFWSYETVSCHDCPPHLRCDPAAFRPTHTVDTGFYPFVDGQVAPVINNPESVQIVSCLYADACNPSGSSPYACQAGYTDVLCSRCERGYFSRGFQCHACRASGKALSIVGNILFLVCVSGLVLAKQHNSGRGHGSAMSNSIFAWLQVTTFVYRSGQLSDSSASNDDNSLLPSWLITIVGDVTSVTPFALECAFPSLTFTGWFYVILCLVPVLVVATCLLAYVLNTMWSCSRHRSGQKQRLLADSAEHYVHLDSRNAESQASTPTQFNNPKFQFFALYIAYIAYLSISRSILTVFNCRQVADDYVGLTHAPYLSCDSSEYTSMLVLAVFGFVVYVIGIPTALLYTIRGNATSGVSPLVRSFLTGSSQEQYWYWEFLVMLRKLVFVAGLSLFPLHSAWAILLVFLVLFASTLLHVYIYPFKSDRENKLEAGLLVLATFTYFVAILQSQSTIHLLSAQVFTEVVNVGVGVILTAYLLLTSVGKWV